MVNFFLESAMAPNSSRRAGCNERKLATDCSGRKQSIRCANTRCRQWNPETLVHQCSSMSYCEHFESGVGTQLRTQLRISNGRVSTSSEDRRGVIFKATGPARQASIFLLVLKLARSYFSFLQLRLHMSDVPDRPDSPNSSSLQQYDVLYMYKVLCHSTCTLP